MNNSCHYIRWFDDLRNTDVPIVGGKNASLGEMVHVFKQEEVSVPEGFATTATVYREFLSANLLNDKIKTELERFKAGEQTLARTGKEIRRLIQHGQFPEQIAETIKQSYREMSQRYQTHDVDVAVRSSATAEDLPEASFAGQQETFLNVTGELELLEACRKCFASLFTDRAISYREEKGFDHLQVALSVGVQKMVRSDLASSGVMFSLDTETGFPDIVVINAAWGLGENVVQGTVTPDEYRVFKPLLKEGQFRPIVEKILGAKEKTMVYATGDSKAVKNLETAPENRDRIVLDDDEILKLSRWAQAIEKHYGCPMDMEWAKDGETNELFIVQARPETVQSQQQTRMFKTCELNESGERLIEGLAIGQSIATGKVCLLHGPDEIDRFVEGSILVADQTDPDWGPIMKRAAGIITNHGGRTSHAAIVSRELGIPAVIGTGNGTEILSDGQEITLSCAEGDTGCIYAGRLSFEETEISFDNLPETKTRIMLNIASPAAAFRWWRLPVKGIGLARMEFLINNVIKIHPLALLQPERITEKTVINKIKSITKGYTDKKEYFVDHLTNGIAKIAASQYPEAVIVRMSDFKTNEYANLIGGQPFEPKEENPMIGFRGASRYYSDEYRDGFALECQALKRAREILGFDNIIMMIPFVRTVAEADQVLEVLAANGLKRGDNGLQIYMMCEIPSNIFLAEQFADRFDGFSIGSNDLTQLILGVDRDSEILSSLFDERNEAVKKAIRQVINSAHEKGCKVGICGQAPSDHPDFAEFLVQAGIDSISLNPDSVLDVIKRVAKIETNL